MKLRLVIILLLAIGMGACRGQNPLNDPAGIEKERLANGILRKAASQLKQEMGLRPIGTMGQMLYDVERLGLSFYCYRPI